MSQVNKFLYDVPIFNPSNFSYATSTLKMAQPAINNGLTFYKSDGQLYTQSDLVNSSGNIGVGTSNPATKLHLNDTSNDVVIYSRATNIRKNSILRLHANYDSIKENNGNAIIQLGTKESTSSLNPDCSWYIGTHSSQGLNDFDPPLKIGFKGATWGVPGEGDFLTILTGGNVGIGTTTPSAKLHIIQPVDTSASFRVDDQTNDTTPFIIDASGNVGIQTATPNASAILDITSTTKGLLLPRITTMNDITSPAEGLLVYDNTAKQLAFRNATAWVNLSAPRVAEIYYDASSANSSTISLADTASFYRIPFSSAPVVKSGSSDFDIVTSTNFICIRYTGITTTKLATHYITVSVKLTNDAVSLRMKVYKNPTISLDALSGGTIIVSSLQETYLATNEKFYNMVISFTDAPTNGDIFYVGAQGSLVTTLNGRSFTWVTTAY